MEFQDVFAAELATIKDTEIIHIVAKFVSENWPEYILAAPSSGSGKYHPPDERGEGGWVLHARRVFNLCGHLAIAFELDDYAQDILLAAALIHDLCQFKGVPSDNGGVLCYKTQEDHPAILAKELRKHAMNITKDDKERQVLQDIASLVELHSGRWAPSGTVDRYWDELISRRAFPKAEDFLGFLLHVADYIASRENVFVSIPFSKT